MAARISLNTPKKQGGLLGFAAGRMAVRLSLNALLGGSAFGGNIL